VIRIGIADDQELLREGLALILDAQPDMTVVGHASDGVEAIALAREQHPDVIVMDVRMPRLTGVDATRRITVEHPGTRILVLTMFDLDEYVYAALRAGASGFLLKDSPRASLIAAVRSVVTGDVLLAPEVTRRLIAQYAKPDTTPTIPHPGIRMLTDRERQVLSELARGHSNGEIAARLHIGEATVKTHVARLLAKLGQRDRLQLVVLAYETGIAQPGAPSPDSQTSGGVIDQTR
jgi:DNA-binding NarL/FixJ family response regulator